MNDFIEFHRNIGYEPVLINKQYIVAVYTVTFSAVDNIVVTQIDTIDEQGFKVNESYDEVMALLMKK